VGRKGSAKDGEKLNCPDNILYGLINAFIFVYFGAGFTQ
jgi:hypothetical protein